MTAPVLLVGLAIALTLSTATPASAAATAHNQGGLWYYNAFGVAHANAAGADGTGVKVAVLDTQINASWPALAGADITIHEPSFCGDRDGTGAAAPATSTEYNSAQHGTDMTSVIVGNGKGPNGDTGPLGVAPKAHILYYATDYAADPDVPLSQGGDRIACPPEGVTAQRSLDPDLFASSTGEGFAKALDQAVADGANIVTYASNIRATDAVKTAVAAAEHAGVVIVDARTNTTAMTTDLDVEGLNGVVTVQAMDATGALQTASSVADPATDVVGPGVDLLGSSENFAGTHLVSGTSPAANIVGGFLADLKSKYPKATGNQLIQSLLRNTGDGQHALTKDPQNFFGYGIVSLRQMVKVDPTTYPDVNPLLSKDAAATPTYQQVTGHAPDAATPTHTASAHSVSGTTTIASTLVPILIIGGIAVILLVAAIIVLVVVLRRRSRGTRPPEPPRSHPSA